MTQALVSVILPVHNREESVALAIESVLAQTYGHFELIVIDDGSTDGTRRVLDGFGSRIQLLAQAHAGAYAARNLGLRQARCELVAFADSDDAWLPDRSACQVPLMSRQEVGLVFGDAIHVPRTGLTCFRVAPPCRGRVADQFAWCNFVPTCAVLARRRCLEEIGGFSEASALSADYLAWFRIALRHELDFVDRPVAEYTVHAGGISYDLGPSIAARIQLFSDELARTSDARTRAVLRRLLFNLALCLVLVTLRGLARNVSHPLRLAWRAATKVASVEAAPWTAAFAMYQLRVRTRRLFS